MAVTFDAATGDATNASGFTRTYSHTVANQPNRYLGIWVTIGSAQAITGITYAGAALTMRLNWFVGGAGGRELYYWDLVAPATGANNVVITLDTTDTFQVSCTMSAYRVDPSAPRRETNTANGESAAPAVTITSGVGDLVLGWTGWRADGGITDTPDATWTTDSNLVDASGAFGGSAAHEDGAVIVTRADTLSGSARWGAGAVSLRESYTTPLAWIVG